MDMDDILTVARDAQEIFVAGIKVADATNPAALKLRRLIRRVTLAEDLLSEGFVDEGVSELCAAIEEARKP